MRIIPYELLKYTPELSLKALRKEFGMYDYCLNKNKKNKAMQFFLNMGRNYFNLSFAKWVEEMQKRQYYVNSFHIIYSKNIKYKSIKTNFILLLECCIQWEIKNFLPYKIDMNWFDVMNKLKNKKLYYNFNLSIFNNVKEWYKQKFMKLNKKNNLKPQKLDMKKVYEYFHSISS
ncbi:hypothetical protein [Candidatus Phytoplasma oryzae]|nr:hypothetical protein PIE28_00305 [Candidatus Phytoplasma oryzae]